MRLYRAAACLLFALLLGASVSLAKPPPPMQLQVNAELPSLKAAVAAGDVRAIMRLAALQHEGVFVEKDVCGAMRLYQGAGNAWYAPAQYALAKLYISGGCGAVDEAEAYFWLWLAMSEQRAGTRHAVAYDTLGDARADAVAEMRRIEGVLGPAIKDKTLQRADKWLKEYHYIASWDEAARKALFEKLALQALALDDARQTDTDKFCIPGKMKAPREATAKFGEKFTMADCNGVIQAYYRGREQDGRIAASTAAGAAPGDLAVLQREASVKKWRKGARDKYRSAKPATGKEK